MSLGGQKFGDLIGVLNRFLILPCWKSDASPKIPGTCLSAGSWLLNNDMLSWSHCPTKHRRRGDQSFATLMSSFFFWEATVCHISVQPCLVFCRKRCLKDIWYQQNYTQVFVPKRTESSCGCVLEVPSEFWFTSLVFFSAPKKRGCFTIPHGRHWLLIYVRRKPPQRHSIPRCRSAAPLGAGTISDQEVKWTEDEALEMCQVFSKHRCFLKWWYPQIIHFNRVFHYKPSILGYPYFWKRPYVSQTKTHGIPCAFEKPLKLTHWVGHIFCSETSGLPVEVNELQMRLVRWR